MGVFSRIKSFFKSIFSAQPKSKLEDSDDVVFNQPPKPEVEDSSESDFSSSTTPNFTDIESSVDVADQSEIYLQSIRSVVDDIKISYPNAGQWFENLINEQVNQYGSKAVAEGLESVSPHELESLVQIAFYAPEHPDGHSAMIKLWSMITSEIPTTDDLKDMEDILFQ